MGEERFGGGERRTVDRARGRGVRVGLSGRIEEETKGGRNDGEDHCSGNSIEDESAVCRTTRAGAEGKGRVEHAEEQEQ